MKSLIILVLFAFIAAGCTKKEEERPTTTKVENLPRPHPSYDFNDKGPKNETVNLEKGKVNVTYAHKEQGEFVIWLTSTDNSDSHLITNEKGPKVEMVTVDIPKDGTYILNIQTKDSYIISVREKQIGQ